MKRVVVWIYLLSFLIGINFTTPVFAVFCNEKYHLDGPAVTTLFACYSLSVFLFEIPTGVLSDWLGEKKSLVIGTALYLISMILFLSGNVALLYLGEFLFGVGSKALVVHLEFGVSDHRRICCGNSRLYVRPVLERPCGIYCHIDVLLQDDLGCIRTALFSAR